MTAEINDSFSSFIKKALFAGFLIGIGDIIYLTIDNKIVGAMLFALGLLTIIKLNLYLYTGKIGVDTFYRFNRKLLVPMILSNFLGITIAVLPMAYIRPDLMEAINALTKFDKSFVELFVLGIFCGVCMYIAVKAKSDLVTVFAIMVFILSGYEHCIADFPYVIIGFSFDKLIKLFAIIAGNSCGSILSDLLSNGKN
ncbi:MAG: formate/nitrite transporter family protein [Lachnospiraceae bacterium]|nr:formate/nitrite transporter family protein [Lachnospiraceae bacterium]